MLLLALGITGQDGSYLSEILLSKGYKVHGLVRPTSQRWQALGRPLRPGLKIHFGDMSDLARLIKILGSIGEVDEIYHLAAQSHVGVSFESPLLTSDVNALGTLRLLEAMTTLKLEKTTRFYNVRTNIIVLGCRIRIRLTFALYRRLLRSCMVQTCPRRRLKKLRSAQFRHMLHQSYSSSGPL
jgi:GDP-mannose 4,6-dehydratase